MTLNAKAASPSQAGSPENAALTQQNIRRNNTIVRKFRQQFKALIVWLAVRGVLTVACAEHLIDRGGLRHD